MTYNKLVCTFFLYFDLIATKRQLYAKHLEHTQTFLCFIFAASTQILDHSI